MRVICTYVFVSGVVILSLFAASGVAAECSSDRASLRGNWGVAEFSVELATTPRERALGLQGRSQLPLTAGMLFVFEAPVQATFWMKNTPIPLDMLFFSEEGRVKHIHENAVPFDLAPISGGDHVMAVLEINGGLAQRFGMSPGTEIRHPSFEQQIAAWPCQPGN